MHVLYLVPIQIFFPLTIPLRWPVGAAARPGEGGHVQPGAPLLRVLPPPPLTEPVPPHCRHK